MTSRARKQPSTSTNVRVIAYVRLSRLTDESTSIERQIKAVREFCESRGWTLVEIIEEPGVSASKKRLQRPGLTRLRKLVAAGGIDLVLTWKLDRIVRSVSDLATLLDEFAATGTGLASVTQPFDTSTPMGKAMAQMIGIFAELEAATIAERVLDSQAHLRSVGRFAGGRVPFGYRVGDHPSGVGRCWVQEPTEAAAIRQVTALYLRGGSMREAIDIINNQYDFDRTFTAANFRQMAASGAWTGRVVSDGKVERDANGQPVRYGEPIISDSDQARLTARFAATAYGPGHKTTRATLLSGLLRCGTCGGGMVASGSVERRSYRCPDQKMLCATGVGIMMSMANEAVANEFLAHVGNEPVVRFWVEQGSPERLPICEAEIASLTADITAAIEDDRDDEVDALRAKQKALKAERDVLRLQPSEPRMHMEATGQTYAEAWADAEDDVLARRALLDRAIEKITVAKGRQGQRNYDPLTRLSFEWAEAVPERLAG